jgi:hypothetical protein
MYCAVLSVACMALVRNCRDVSDIPSTAALAIRWVDLMAVWADCVA